MKTIIISLLIFFTANLPDGKAGAQNVWYIDYNTPAGESGNGTSWATAWKYLGNGSGGYGGIDWSVISSGDTIFMSGGVDSLRYLAKFSGQAHYVSPQTGTEYTFDPPVILCPSWESSKNGTVVLSILNAPDATRGVLEIGNTVNGVKVTGLTIRDIRTPDISPASVMISIFGNNNILEGNKIITAGMTTGIGFQGYNITIKDNYYEEPENHYVFGNDPIGGMGGTGTIVDGNVFILRNSYTAVPNQTANASVTTTATTLTDTRVNEETDYHVGITIQVNGNWNMTVTGNSGGTFTGSDGWEYAPFGVSADNSISYGSNYVYDGAYTYADDYFKGTTITANGKTMIVASNTGHYIYGTTNWVGGTPANTSGYSFSAPTGSYPPQGCAWRMEGAHRDGMQFSAWDIEVGSPPTSDILTTIMSNNIIVDEGTRGTGWNGIIYTSSINAHQRWLVYNNIFVSKQEISSAGIFMYSTTPDDFMSMKFFNNTIIVKGSGSQFADGRYSTGAFWLLSTFDSLEVKNNLFVCDTTMASLGRYTGGGSYVKDIDNNIYAYDDYNRETFGFVDGGTGYVDLAGWRALGNDVNGDTLQSSNVTFTNKYGYLRDDYRTTTGMGMGEDLSAKYPYMRYDASGNDRGSSWDIGAIQYNGIPPVGNNDINLKGKLYLQGPFNANSMNTNLSQNSLLPNTQPYNSAPWNYNGNESLSSGSSSGYVDWVLVELRNSTNPTQVVSRRAAILNNDGTLLNTDGSAGVPFSNIQEGTYYVAVFHRNHLAVMSAAPVQLTANSQLYDFTSGMNKAFGTNPMADLGVGKFGMYASDGNSNGGINITDRNEVWAPQNGNMGYLKGDFNLDGGVTASDVNLYWNINNGKMTQVP